MSDQHADRTSEEIARLYFDIFNERALDELDDLLTEDFVSHLRVGDVEGREPFKVMMVDLYEAFPDMEWILDELICTADRVIYRYAFQGTHRGAFMGIAPSNKFIRAEGAEVLHLANGWVTEVWNYTDLMGLAARLHATHPLSMEL